jgi:hypothetical protein
MSRYGMTLAQPNTFANLGEYAAGPRPHAWKFRIEPGLKAIIRSVPNDGPELEIHREPTADFSGNKGAWHCRPPLSTA